ncbi:MAG: GDYXXLXY domain-containing protein [Microcoleaceae cyanobacterium]
MNLSSKPNDRQQETVTEPLPTDLKPRPIQSIKGWRFWIPLLFQLGLILAVPAAAIHTQITGKTAVLQTAPVDPYDFLRGYFQTLNYDISSLETLSTLPGWQGLTTEDSIYLPVGTTVYVTLESPVSETAESTSPAAWKPVAVDSERPTSLASNQIAIKGQSAGARIEYGLERYYMPEDQREIINQTIRDTQSNDPQSFVVEVKVSQNGKAIPTRLWVGDQSYQF